MASRGTSWGEGSRALSPSLSLSHLTNPRGSRTGHFYDPH